MSTPSASDSSFAAVYEKHGDPASVLEWKSVPVGAPGPGEVTVVLECAVIHPSDFGIIANSYGRPRPAPAVAGREGVGRVERVGGGVTRLRAGDRVRMPADAGVWRERGVYPENELTRVPEDLAPEAAAQSFVNPPTAVLLLEEIVKLSPGDIVVQNAGNSAVGKAVAFYGKKLGLRVISFVRDPAKHAGELIALGAEAVFADDDDAPKKIAALKGAGSVRLALNSVGGASVMRLIKACDAGASVVTFGAMTGEPVRFPTRELIFSDLVLRGFWIDRWYRTASPEAVAALNEKVYALWRGGFPTGVDAVYPVDRVTEAVVRAAQPGRSGKILLRGPASQ